jgi:predicted O-linked N-acetylglucosamine transferase (SPINDLY family)
LETTAVFAAAQHHLERGDLDACWLLCEEILRQEPAHAGALHCLGLLLAKSGEAERAVAILEKAVATCPLNVSWRHSLGVAYGLAGRWREAANAFCACLAFDHNHLESRVSYASALLECGRLEEALVEARQALRAAPESAFLHRTMGRVLAAMGQPVEAARSFRQCVLLGPDNPNNLESAGDFFGKSGEESLTAELFASLSKRLPESPGAWSRSAAAYMAMGARESAADALRKALALDPGNPCVHSALLYSSIMDPAQSGEDLLTAHREWQTAFTSPAPAKPFENSSERERRIRLGILSGEFSSGSIDFFLPPILRHHDRRNIELFAYSAGANEDSGTRRYKQLFHHWRDVSDLTDGEVDATIRADRIDILLDVSGHLPPMRLSVFATRAAPVQIAYPRYPCTTGLDAMDYRITDQWADPAGLTESHYREKLLRIPSGYLVYQPPDGAPSVAALPARANRYVTFGFFQTPLKLNHGVFDALAATMLQVPESRMLFHYMVGDFDRPERLARQRIENAMDERGIDPARLVFRGPLPLSDHLALISQTDVALDAFPFSGQTNTCECLWMGVPVVTLAGARFSARVSAAILSRAGLSDWVATTESEYAEIASRQALNLPALLELRRTLRNRFAASPVLDGARVVRELEVVYRQVWRVWCGSTAG